MKKKPEKKYWFSSQVDIHIICIICMWPTSAPRGPPFSVLKGESARTIAVFLGDRKANFHVCADTMHRSLSCSPVQIRATASFHTAAIVPDLSPPLFLSLHGAKGSFILRGACHIHHHPENQN